MLSSALRTGARSVRRAGWRGALLALAIAALSFADDWLPLLFVTVLLQQVGSFAMIRLFAAQRTETPGTVTAADADLGTALRTAALLGRAALRYAAVSLLVSFAAVLVTLGLASLAHVQGLDDARHVAPEFAAGAIVLGALFGSFFVVGEQRIALERDQRVLVACAHAARIARWDFGTVFGLNLLASTPGIALQLATGSEPSLLAQLFALPFAAFLAALVTAAYTSVYLAGPRLDVPDDFGRRAKT